MATLILIAAVAQNRAIGKNNQLLWHLPEDLRFFRQTTLHHPIIMGRKTFDSIGKPLPKRTNIVLTRDLTWSHPDVLVAHSLDAALTLVGDTTCFVIGGAEIYELALPHADRLILTEVKSIVEGDAFFPEWSADHFVEVSRVPGPGVNQASNLKDDGVSDALATPYFEFVEYHRRVL